MKTLWTNRRYVVIDDFTSIKLSIILFLLQNDEDIEDILDEGMADFEEESVIKSKVRIYAYEIRT